MTDDRSSDPKCDHDPFTKRNSLIIEAHWGAGVRVRCKACGLSSYVTQKGRIRPNAELHTMLEERAND